MEITAGTITRTIILALALINQILSATGHAVIPIEDAAIETLVSTAFTIVASLITWWKNNSFTYAARLGDFHMRKARQEAAEDKRFKLNGK